MTSKIRDKVWAESLSKRERTKRILVADIVADVMRDFRDGMMNSHECCVEIYDLVTEHGLIRRPK